KLLRQHFIVVSVPFSTQNGCAGGVKAYAYTPDRQKFDEFHWGTDRRHSGLPFLERQHEANVTAVRTFLEECVKKNGQPATR
ncbi:MAG TPA: hypothetical protein VEL76_00960, partial [Gemmataceae bacterium]|nr:hypothetical protein [Gemmataceae bacterium]